MQRDIIGQKFGRLTVLKFHHRIAKHQYFLCECSCGSACIVDKQKITSGYTRSCGCLMKELVGKRARIHGQSKSKTYRIWIGMKDRCVNKNNIAYKNYGGRGITACKRWKESFINFLSDMGEAPAGLTIERKNNNKGYSPDNCGWASRLEQNNNSRKNHYEIMGGTKLSLASWARLYNINYGTLRSRIRTGWTIEQALTTSV